MKRPPKKLRLDKETVRAMNLQPLDGPRLARVAGASAVDPGCNTSVITCSHKP